MNEGEIDGKVYPIAIGENGETLWQTVNVAEERDEVWEDWSLGLGETKRETGRGYLFSPGFDASTRGALRFSPFYHNLNNTALTTDYGYFMEAVEASGSTLNIDAHSTSKGSLAEDGTLSWDHTVASQSERLLIVACAYDSRLTNDFTATYDGVAMTRLSFKLGVSPTVAGLIWWYLHAPATGTNSIVVTNHTGSTRAVVTGASSFYGVNADDPFGTVVSATGTDGTPTVTVTPVSGEQILAVVAVEGAATIAAGSDETERWDQSQSTDVAGSGYTQAGSVAGGVLAPSLTSGSNWVEIAVPIKPSSVTSRSVMQIADTSKIFRYTYDSDTGLTLDATDTTASGVAGRPAKMNGNWYVPMSTAASAQKITGVTVADVTGTWEADHLSTYQKGITPTLARVNADTQHQVDFNEDTGDVGDNWSGGQKAGDSSTKITELLEAQGLLFVCKEDSVYEFGVEAESRNAIPFLDRGKIDSDNGKGSFAFGDEIIYMTKGDMWRYRIGRGALPIGLNTIRSWRKIDDIIDTPKDGRPAFGVHVGEYWYYLENDGELSHLIQARKRREGDPAGHELIQHSVLTIPLSKGLGVDSRNHLWIKGASTDETTRDIRVIELAEDGSLDVQNRKGQASSSHLIYFDERNPGRPQDQVQLRRFTVETEGDWDATTPLDIGVFIDDSQFAQALGSPITSAGVSTQNWTVGTNDTCFRFRPLLGVTTTSSYTPKSSQPDILRVIIGIRFPEIIRIVIPADDGILANYGTTAIDVEQNLRRLQNQGTVTFRRPGDTTTTFSADILEVTDTMYQDNQENYAHGIQLQLRSWITP